MRHLLTGWVIVAASILAPTVALAGNQEMAEQIAAKLRDSGRLEDRDVGVKYLDGTVWLKGQVASQDEISAAMRLAQSVEGVDRVVNELTVGPVRAASASGVQQVSASLAQPPQPLTVRFAQAPVPAAPAAVVPATPSPTAPAAPSGVPVPAPAARAPGAPLPAYVVPAGHHAPAPMTYDQPQLPAYAWPSYAAYPNYAGVTYPRQYSATAWPYIGPFYPYPQVPLGWRKVTLQWDDGWWFLDFKDKPCRSWTAFH